MRVQKVAQKVVNNNMTRAKTYYLENVRKGLLTHPSQVYWINEPPSTDLYIKKIDEQFSWIDTTNKKDEDRITKVDRSYDELTKLVRENLLFNVPADITEYFDIVASEYLDLSPEKIAYYKSMDYDGTQTFLSKNKDGEYEIDWDKFMDVIPQSTEEVTKLQRAPKAQREAEKTKFKMDHAETEDEPLDLSEWKKDVPDHYVDQLEKDVDFVINNLPEVDTEFVDHFAKYNVKVAQKVLDDAHDMLPNLFVESVELKGMLEALRVDPEKENTPRHYTVDPFFVEEFLPEIVDHTILEIEYDNWDVLYADEIRRFKKPIEEYLSTYDRSGINTLVNKYFNDEKNENALSGGLSEREIFEKKLFKRVSELIEQNKNLLADISALKQEGASTEKKDDGSEEEDRKEASDRAKISDTQFWQWTNSYLNFEKELYDDFAERGEEAVKEWVAKRKQAAEGTPEAKE